MDELTDAELLVVLRSSDSHGGASDDVLLSAARAGVMAYRLKLGPTAELPFGVKRALSEAASVIGSINQGSQHKVRINDEDCFWQRQEWVAWATYDVLPKLRALLDNDLAAAKTLGSCVRDDLEYVQAYLEDRDDWDGKEPLLGDIQIMLDRADASGAICGAIPPLPPPDLCIDADIDADSEYKAYSVGTVELYVERLHANAMKLNSNLGADDKAPDWYLVRRDSDGEWLVKKTLREAQSVLRSGNIVGLHLDPNGPVRDWT